MPLSLPAMVDEGYEPKHISLLSFFCHNEGESNMSSLGLHREQYGQGPVGLASSHLSPGWPGALWLGEQLAQPILRVRLEALVFIFFLSPPPPTLQVQGVSRILKNVDKKSSSSLEGGGGDFWALWNPSSEKMLHQKLSPL